MIRRCVDLLLGGILLIALLPLFATIALAIRATMGRPISPAATISFSRATLG